MNRSLSPPPHFPCPLASEDRILSLSTQGRLLSAQIYRDQGAEGILSSFTTVKTYSSLYGKRTPEPGSTGAGSPELVYHECTTITHLHTRPTENLICPVAPMFTFMSVGFGYSDDFTITRFLDPVVMHISRHLLSPLFLNIDTPSLLLVFVVYRYFQFSRYLYT